MILLIDYREKGFIDNLKKKGENIIFDEINEVFLLGIDKNTSIYYKITNLDIGDFLICNYDLDKSQTIDLKFIYENLVLLIERKTYDDLSSSIIDGRFREQKTRIEDSLNDNSKVMYIIEGHIKEKEKHGVKMNILEGAIINLIFKHKFKVLNTMNIDNTFQNIVTILKKYKKREFDIKNDTNDKNDNQKEEIISVPDINFANLKKADRISNNIFNLQLCVIPGVSINIAKKITTHYKTMIDLINTYNENEDNNKKENLLADIQITDKRKLGKALSKKIYNALHTC